jgi:NADP-dependent 3-hydroxy acid dehydrogenase YdfG
MSNKLSGKVAVVTGASKGIGAAIAIHLAGEGAAVAVNYASSKAGADKVVTEIARKGGRAVAVQADVSKPEDVRRLFAETKKAFGRLDVLVNNAGIYEFAPLEEVTPDHFHRQFNLNVLGVLLATREAVQHFGDAGGSVINISSVVAKAALPNASVYSASKAAVDAVTRVGGQEDSRQRHQSRHGRNRGDARAGHPRKRDAHAGRGPDAPGPHRAARRHRPRGGVLRFGGFRLGYRPDPLHHRRVPLRRNRARVLS